MPLNKLCKYYTTPSLTTKTFSDLISVYLEPVGKRLRGCDDERVIGECVYPIYWEAFCTIDTERQLG